MTGDHEQKAKACLGLAAALWLLLMVAALQNTNRTHNSSRSTPCQGSDLLDHDGRTCVRRRRVQASNEDDAEVAATRNVSSSSSSYSFSTQHGCLHSVMPDNWTTRRVCNSQDSPESISSGACRQSAPSSSSSTTPEVRIFAQDSESSIVSAWLLQIILSEMLHIPTSIETGVSALSSARFNFYNPNHDDDISESESDFSVNQLHVMTSPNAIQEALENAQLFHQDCTMARGSGSGSVGDTSSSNSTSSTAGGQEEQKDNYYQPCAHYIPESWHVNPEIMHNKELVETPPLPMGLLVQEGWYIPKFTAHRDATLTSYIGMQNAHPDYSNLLEENRRRHMADTFLQPTTWHDYCIFVSLNACTIPDEHAQRAPSTSEEDEAYYFKSCSSSSSNSSSSSGSGGAVLYTGHFQKSGRNDCDNQPTACMGHMGDYPCTWTSYAQAQTHHLNIFLEDNGNNGDDDTPQRNSRGYSIQQLQQLWHAANATQSNIVIMWYDTSFIHHQYQATPAKFIKVTLPPTTQECLDNRVASNDDQCSIDLETRVGSPLGVCDYPVQPLYKLVSAGLRNLEATTSTTTTTPKSLAASSSKNSAYTVLRDFTLSNAQLSEIYDYWMQAKKTSATANSSSAAAAASPRQALCQWAADNMDHLESFIPAYYPRSLVDEPQYSSSVMVAAVVIASLAMLLVLLVAINVLRLRQQGVMQAGPLSSLYIMLVGAMCLCLGALLAAMPTTDGTCTAEIWLVNWGLGVFGLVPIMVKLRAIRQGACIATKSKKTMHDEETITTATATTTTITRNNRVVPSAKNVYGAVFLVGVAVSIVLIIWTVVDPPQKQVAGYNIMTDMPPQGGGEETIVQVSYYCSSNQIFWNFLSIAWNMFLLACATVLVCQTNKIRQDFNEPTLLAVLVYCHSVFVMLWLISMLLSSSSSAAAAGNDGNNVNQSSLTGFRSIVFSLDVMATLLVYFIPKFVVRQEEDDTAAEVKALGPIARWISNISGVSSCKTAEANSVEKGTPRPAAPESLEQAPRAIPANTTLETHELSIETSLSNSVTPSYSRDDDDDTGGVAQLRASVDRLKWEGQTLRSEVETKDRTIALLESEVESLMEICMNHPRRGVNMDPSETEGADDSENYIEESPFVVETPTNADKSEKDDEEEDEEEEPEEPGKIQKPTFAEPIGKGNFDYSLSTIYEDVDLAQLRDDEAKLIETMQENQKAAVLASTPRELSKRIMIERALTEVDV